MAKSKATQAKEKKRQQRRDQQRKAKVTDAVRAHEARVRLQELATLTAERFSHIAATLGADAPTLESLIDGDHAQLISELPSAARAQQLAYDALLAESDAQARASAEAALELDPESLDARLVLLGQDALDRVDDDDSADEAFEELQGPFVQLGLQALDALSQSGALQRHPGDVWIEVTTRP